MTDERDEVLARAQAMAAADGYAAWSSVDGYAQEAYLDMAAIVMIKEYSADE